MTSDKKDIDKGREAAEIVKRIGAGDRSAETLLVERYGLALTGMIRARMRNDSRHDDIYQETIWFVIQRLRGEGLNEPEKLPAFMMGVAKNMIRSRRRSDHDDVIVRDPDLVDDIVHSDPSVIEEFSGEQFRQAVDDLIRRLPNPRYREILYRHHVLAEEKKWICGAMDLSPANFDRVIHRARNALRKLLDDDAIVSMNDFFEK